MTNNIKPGGAILSPADPRDYTIARGMEVSGDPLPEQFEVWTSPVANQGQRSNCVAQALACIVECRDHQLGREHKDRSVGFIYGMASNAEYSQGMYPREAVLILKDHGDVYAADWECLLDNPACAQERAKVSEAIKNKAVKAAMGIRLNTEDEMKMFIQKYGLPVMVVVDIEETYGAFWGSGKHALVCHGWDDSRRRWLNYAKKYTGKWLHLQDSYGTGGARGDGTRWAHFDELKEIWGIVFMEEKKFTDVDANRWSADAIKWAAEQGLLIGYEDGTFRPDKPLTREELAAVLQRLASK